MRVERQLLADFTEAIEHIVVCSSSVPVDGALLAVYIILDYEFAKNLKFRPSRKATLLNLANPLNRPVSYAA